MSAVIIPSNIADKFQRFINIVIPMYDQDGVGFTSYNIEHDGNFYYTDASISISRYFEDEPVVWATLKLRIVYNIKTEAWSSVKMWKFLVDPIEGIENNYKEVISRNVEYNEAVMDLATIMRSDISTFANKESARYDINDYWPEYNEDLEDAEASFQ